jgi:hypothetical protein
VRLSSAAVSLAQDNWPAWWQWELELTRHTRQRLQERNLSEIELRRLLYHARSYRASWVEGRWRIEGRHGGRRWVVVVEPDLERELLVVVTLFAE